MSKFKKELDKLYARAARKPKTPQPNLKCPKTEKKLDPISTKKIASEYFEKLRHASINQKQIGDLKTTENDFDNEKKPPKPTKF